MWAGCISVDPLKFCFVHIPKCGGTSFRSIAASLVGARKVLPAVNNFELVQMGIPQIRAYDAAVGHFDHGIFDVLPPDTLRFTILRDPVHRYLSTVSHMMRDPAFSHLHPKVRGLTIDDAALHPDVVKEMRNSVVKLFCHMTIPTGIASESNARIAEQSRGAITADIDLAIAHLETYEVVGTQERYFESVQLMLISAGLPPIKVTPLLNEDRSERQHDASPAVADHIRELLDLDQRLYEYARRRLDESISSTLYQLSVKEYTSSLPLLPPRYKFHLDELPGSYGWYTPETDENGTRLWGGLQDEQGFVLRVEPGTRYVITARLGKRDPDHALWVKCNVWGYETLITATGVVIRFETGPSDRMVDIAFVYPNAKSPRESGLGADRRKLGLVLYALAIFKVRSFDEIAADRAMRLIHEAVPGLIAA
jgi:hypothetical protein